MNIKIFFLLTIVFCFSFNSYSIEKEFTFDEESAKEKAVLCLKKVLSESFTPPQTDKIGNYLLAQPVMASVFGKNCNDAKFVIVIFPEKNKSNKGNTYVVFKVEEKSDLNMIRAGLTIQSIDEIILGTKLDYCEEDP